MDFDLWLIVTFFAGFYVGYKLAINSIAYRFYQLARLHGINLEENNRLEEPKVSRYPDCKLEVHNDILYLFDKSTDTFLCQGYTFEELASNLKKNQGINQARIIVDNKNIYLINGEVKKDTP